MNQKTFQNYKFIIAIIIQVVLCREIVYNPNPMTDLNIFKLTNQNIYILAMSEDNQFAYISAREGGVFVISLTNIIQPTIIKTIPTLQSQYLFIKKGFLFICDILDGLLIYNISNPFQPTLISKWQTYLNSQAFQVTQDLKYGFILQNGVVFSIDLTDLKNPLNLSKNGKTKLIY